MRARLVWTVLVALVCSATWSSGCSSGGASVAPACTRAIGLADIDASTTTTACTGARAYVSCSLSNGGGQACLSDDPGSCPANAGGPSGGSCKDQCAADEYGVACGGPGAASSAQPPSGCYSVAATPGGVAFYCCPCL